MDRTNLCRVSIQWTKKELNVWLIFSVNGNLSDREDIDISDELIYTQMKPKLDTLDAIAHIKLSGRVALHINTETHEKSAVENTMVWAVQYVQPSDN